LAVAAVGLNRMLLALVRVGVMVRRAVLAVAVLATVVRQLMAAQVSVIRVVLVVTPPTLLVAVVVVLVPQVLTQPHRQAAQVAQVHLLH